MYSRLKADLNFELSQIRELLSVHLPLIRKVSAGEPTLFERSAIAGMLHSFYNGVESMFKRIAAAYDGGLPQGEGWHVRLLDSMSEATSTRTKVISQLTHENLAEYLGFRHVYRGIYPFQLKWERFSDLVLNFERVTEMIEAEVRQFVETLG